MRSTQLLLSGGLAWAFALPAAAGVTVIATHGDDKNEQSTIYVEGNKMRIESNRGKESLMIYDGDQQKMYLLQPEKKTYSEITPQTIRSATDRARKQLDEAKTKMTPEQRKQYEEMMNKLPADQRERMAQAIGQQPAKEKPSDLKWERTGTKDTVAGYPCEGFREIKDGKPEAEGCFIPWSAGAITKADLAPFKKMEQFLAESGTTPPDKRLSTFARLENGPGFPGVWKSADSDAKAKQTVTSIKRGGISSDKFQIPAGYTKTDPFAGGGK